MKKLVVLSGAGISAESGIKLSEIITDSGKSPDWRCRLTRRFCQNPKLVLDFYNARRKQLKEVEPNRSTSNFSGTGKSFRCTYYYAKCRWSARAQRLFKIIHLHGELRKARSVNHRKWYCGLRKRYQYWRSASRRLTASSHICGLRNGSQNGKCNWNRISGRFISRYCNINARFISKRLL